MEALIFFIFSLVFNALVPIWLPWWVIVPIHLLLTVSLRLSRALAFWLGGISPAIVWLGYSIWLSFQNDHILVPRLAQVLMLPHPVLYFGIVFIVPFLVGGFSALIGVLLKNFLVHHGT